MSASKMGLDDYLVAYSPDALRRRIDTAEPVGTQRPTLQQEAEPLGGHPTGQQEPYGSPVVPLGVGSGGQVPPKPFPLDALPGKLRAFVASAARALPCPPDYIACLILVVLATLIGRKCCIQVKPGWVERAVLWLLVVARSGDRKSPAFNLAFAPLGVIQKKLSDQYRREVKEWTDLDAGQRAKTPKPRLRQIIARSFTIEALNDLLADNPSVCVAADEAVGVVRSLGQYKGGKGDDRQQLLSLWSSMDIAVNRKGADPILITDPNVCFGGGVQPDVSGEVVGDGKEDGLGARFLFSFPAPLPRADWTDDAPTDTAGYQAVCDELWKLKPSETPLTLDPPAKKVWVAWVNDHRRQEPPDCLRPFWSKCEGYALRLALVLFVSRRACGESNANRIDRQSMSGAVELIRYFQNHAERVYGVANERGDGGRLGAVLRWIRKQGGETTARKLRMYGVGGVKSSLEAEELLDDLAAHGHGAVTTEARGSVVFKLGATASDAEGGAA